MSLVAYNSSDESEEEMQIVKKQKESVKIRIPSLKEFEDDEDEKIVAKTQKPQLGTGLFSLLPPPKHTTTLSKPGFIPHILKSKKEHTVISHQNKNKHGDVIVMSNPSVVSEEQKSEEENSFAKEKSYEESSSASGNSDFFWLDDLASSNKVKEDDHDDDISVKKNSVIENLSSQLPSPSNNMQRTYLNDVKEIVYMKEYQQLSGTDAHEVDQKSDHAHPSEHQLNSLENYSGVNEGDQNELLLKDKEFLKLQGRRKEFKDINIIDVNANDQLTDKNEWLMKNITEETTHRPKRKHNMPTQQQKRKHQITYLAFQAKEREMDLKNQWSLNNRTRRETQAKYGF